jgi:hypothetical protein
VADDEARSRPPDPPPVGAPPLVTRARAVAVTVLLALLGATLVTVAFLRPLWLLAVPVLALGGAAASGLVLFVRARLRARQRRGPAAAPQDGPADGGPPSAPRRAPEREP